MAKHLVDIDDELLERARAELGTATMKDTVNTALAEVVALAARRRHLVERFESGEPLVADPGAVESAWR